MKKMLLILLLCGGLLCGCAMPPKGNSGETPLPSTEGYRVGVWLSYLEVDKLLQSDFESGFNTVLENCKSLGVTDLFVHVRPFCDAIYPSAYFPMRASAHQSFDVLERMVEKTHAAGMCFHAWINPYRIRTQDDDLSALDPGSPVTAWIGESETGNDVCFHNGIYLNPASARARKLVLDGIRELLNGYAIDGIHFDDYFYPTDKADFDAESYRQYCADCEEPLSLGDWRRANVNELISAVYTVVKFYDRTLIFSVSPAASVEKNKTAYFADVAAWMESGCIDWIIPQLYFGFNYPQEEFCFDRLTEEWRSLPRAETVRMMVGLAAYKMNVKQMPDTEEWYMNAELLADEVKYCRSCDGVSGHIYYSYTALFSNEDTNRRARERLQEEEHVKND